jgi:hypothetical protein
LKKQENIKSVIIQNHNFGFEGVEESGKAFGYSVTKVQEQLRSWQYEYGVARPCKGGHYSYEVIPLRLIAYVEEDVAKSL